MKNIVFQLLKRNFVIWFQTKLYIFLHFLLTDIIMRTKTESERYIIIAYDPKIYIYFCLKLVFNLRKVAMQSWESRNWRSPAISVSEEIRFISSPRRGRKNRFSSPLSVTSLLVLDGSTGAI